MNIFITEIRAFDPLTNEICNWCGPRIEAKNFRDAQNYCNSHGLGYCRVIGKLVDVIEDKKADICLN